MKNSHGSFKPMQAVDGKLKPQFRWPKDKTTCTLGDFCCSERSCSAHSYCRHTCQLHAPSSSSCLQNWLYSGKNGLNCHLGKNGHVIQQKWFCQLKLI